MRDRWPDSTVYSVVVVVLQGKRTWVMTGHCQSRLDRDRQDPGRPVRTWWEWPGPQTRPEWTGPDRTGTDRNRHYPIGPVITRPDRNGPDRTGTNRTKPDRTLPDRTKPNRTIPDRTTPHCKKPHQNGSNGYCTCTAVRTKDQNETDGASPDRTGVERNKM